MFSKTKSTWAAAGLVALLAGGAALQAVADDKAPPATQPTARTTRRHKLTYPWVDMKTLTPDQVDKIEKIHADSVEQQDKIKQKELDDIDALLKPDQLKEVDAIESAKKEAGKEKAAAKRTATTKPTGK